MLTRMARLLIRMARMLTRMTRMARMLTRWLAGSHIIHTPGKCYQFPSSSVPCVKTYEKCKCILLLLIKWNSSFFRTSPRKQKLGFRKI